MAKANVTKAHRFVEKMTSCKVDAILAHKDGYISLRAVSPFLHLESQLRKIERSLGCSWFVAKSGRNTEYIFTFDNGTKRVVLTFPWIITCEIRLIDMKTMRKRRAADNASVGRC